ERRESAVRASVHGKALLVELGLLRHPLRDRAEITQVDPAPVPVDRGLPRATVAGRSMDVRHHERDAVVHERSEMRQVRRERGSRLPLGSAMWIQDRGHWTANTTGPVHEARDVAVRRRDADELRLDELAG